MAVWVFQRLLVIHFPGKSDGWLEIHCGTSTWHTQTGAVFGYVVR